MAHASTDDIVPRLILLQYQPLALDIFRRKAPISFCVEVAEIQFILLSPQNCCYGPRYLSGHKGLTAARGLVVEKNTVAGKQVVAFTVIYRNPVGVCFCRCIGTSRVKISFLVLR